MAGICAPDSRQMRRRRRNLSQIMCPKPGRAQCVRGRVGLTRCGLSARRRRALLVSADGVGKCPERQPEKRDVFEEKLTEKGNGREAAASQLTYPRRGEQEADRGYEQHDGHQAAHDRQSRRHRLDGQQERRCDLERT
jgi:hypothetical protein